MAEADRYRLPGRPALLMPGGGEEGRRESVLVSPRGRRGRNRDAAVAAVLPEVDGARFALAGGIRWPIRLPSGCCLGAGSQVRVRDLGGDSFSVWARERTGTLHLAGSMDAHYGRRPGGPGSSSWARRGIGERERRSLRGVQQARWTVPLPWCPGGMTAGPRDRLSGTATDLQCAWSPRQTRSRQRR